MKTTSMEGVKPLNRNEMKMISGGIMDADLLDYQFGDVFPYVDGITGKCTWMVDVLWVNGLKTSIPWSGYNGGSCDNVC